MRIVESFDDPKSNRAVPVSIYVFCHRCNKLLNAIPSNFNMNPYSSRQEGTWMYLKYDFEYSSDSSPRQCKHCQSLYVKTVNWLFSKIECKKSNT